MNKKSFLIMLLFLVLFTLTSCGGTHKHEFGQWVTQKEATCTDAGTKQRECECGYKEVEFINKKPHTEVIDEAKLATCEESGLSVGKHCSVCNVILEEQVVIPATGHNYSNTWDYIAEDGHAHKCLKCDYYDVIEHTSSGAANETTSEICTDCGYIITPATGHINHEQSTNLSHDAKNHWYYCTSCNAVKYEVTEHNFGEYILDTPASTSSEGLLKAECADCGYISILKIMKTPVLVKNGSVLTWDNVPGASGYYLYNGSQMIADLGNVNRYAVSSLSMADAQLSIVAYTLEPLYRELSEQSNTVSLMMSEINLQADLGTDFEGYQTKETLFGESNLSTGWKADDNEKKAFGIQSTWQANKLFREIDNNIALKMYGTGNNVIRVGLDINDEIKNPGVYKISIKVKAGPKADNISSILFRFHNKSSLLNANAIRSEGIYFKNPSTDTFVIPKDEWMTLETEFTLVEPLQVKDDLCIVLMLYTNNVDLKEPENYALVDDVEIYKLNEINEQNISKFGEIDFEGFDPETNSGLYASGNMSNGWKKDQNGKTPFRVISGWQGVKLFHEEDGNEALKVAGGKDTIRCGIEVAESIAEPGIYKVSFKAKLGPNADEIGAIKIAIHDKGNVNDGKELVSPYVIKEKSEDVGLSKDGWVILEIKFVITKKIEFNSDLCFILSIDTYGSKTTGTDLHAGNYVLVDDIQFFKYN